MSYNSARKSSQVITLNNWIFFISFFFFIKVLKPNVTKLNYLRHDFTL